MREKRTLERLYNLDDSYVDELVHRCEYDDRGLLVKEVSYYHKGEMESITTYTYREDLQVENIRKKYIEIDSIEEVKHFYNAKNQRIKISRYLRNELSGEELFSYNEAGQLVEKNRIDYDDYLKEKEIVDYEKGIKKYFEYSADDSLFLERTTTLNEKGNPIKEVEVVYGGINEGELETINTYNDKEQLINTKMYEEGEMTLNEDYFFNEQGFEIRSVGYDFDLDRKVEIQRLIDDKGRILKEEQVVNGVLANYFEKVYNENGQLVYKKVFDLEEGSGIEEEREFVYEYEG